VIPLLVYLAIYAFQSDQIVEIRLIDKPEATPYRASDHVSVDGGTLCRWRALRSSS